MSKANGETLTPTLKKLFETGRLPLSNWLDKGQDQFISKTLDELREILFYDVGAPYETLKTPLTEFGFSVPEGTHWFEWTLRDDIRLAALVKPFGINTKEAIVLLFSDTPERLCISGCFAMASDKFRNGLVVYYENKDLPERVRMLYDVAADTILRCLHSLAGKCPNIFHKTGRALSRPTFKGNVNTYDIGKVHIH